MTPILVTFNIKEVIQGEDCFPNMPIYQENIHFGSHVCETLVKLKITVEMRGIIIVIGERLEKYSLGTVGLHITFRDPEGII